MSTGATSTTPAPALQMQGMVIGALKDPNLVVAEDVNWTVNPGDFWVIAGLQGAGKTDFLLTAAGLMAPVSGDYRLFGEPMPIFDEARLSWRLKLGLVFDGGQLFNHLTVRENIALPLRYHKNLVRPEADAEVTPLLERMELGPWADSTPGAIGRNWAKRVGLARALMLRPEVLLVDNPLGGLDLLHTHWWLSFLENLSAGTALPDRLPVTLAVTTADFTPWKNRARQFAVLRNKRFTVLGTVGQMESAKAELLRELLSAQP